MAVKQSLGSMVRVLDKLGMQLMITDPETDTVLYANDRVVADYSLEETPEGKRCWELFQRGARGRCGSCPLWQLQAQPNRTFVRESRDRANGRWYRTTHSMVDWPDGRRVHLMQGEDITESLETQRHLREAELRSYRMHSEIARQSKLFEAVNRVASLLLESHPGEYLVTLRRAIKVLGECVGAARASLWRNERNESGALFSRCLTGWLCGHDVATPYPEPVVDLSACLPQWCGKQDSLPDINSPISKIHESLHFNQALQCCKSMLLLPIHMQGEFWGFIAFVHREKQVFPAEERAILHSGAMMLANMTIRHELARNLKQAQHSAMTDPLTGLLNRKGFNKKAREILNTARIENKRFTLLFLDLDHFKQINDTYGHSLGDEVLIEFSNMLRENLRPEDLICRSGGEEFLAMLYPSAEDVGTRVSERILAQCRKMRFPQHPELSITASAGVFSGFVKRGDTLERIVNKSDRALYAAKRAGRDRVVSYGEWSEKITAQHVR